MDQEGAASVLVPVPVLRAKAVRHAELPLPEANIPPRVYLQAATEALKDTMPWGESGREFLKAVFIAPGGEFRHVSADTILQHCLDAAPGENSGRIHDGMARQLDRFSACGLIIADRHPIKFTQYFLNPAHGMSDLLSLKKEEGIEVLSSVCGNFNAADALEYLGSRFPAPFKSGTTGADILARLSERTPLSELLKDDSLFEAGAIRGYSERQQLGRFLNACIACGAVRFETAKKEGAVHELFSVTDDLKPLLGAGTGLLPALPAL